MSSPQDCIGSRCGLSVNNQLRQALPSIANETIVISMPVTSRVLCECGYDATFTLRPIYTEASEPWIEVIPARKRTFFELLCLKPKPKSKKLLRKHHVDHMVPAYDLEKKEITAVAVKDIAGNERFEKIPPETWNVLIQAEAQDICGETDDMPPPTNTLICPKCGSNNIWLARPEGGSIHMTIGNPDYMKPVFVEE